MKVATALLLSAVLLTTGVALAPTATALSCAAEPPEIEPVVCGAISKYFCVAESGTMAIKRCI